jgi:hypothetical protein
MHADLSRKLGFGQVGRFQLLLQLMRVGLTGSLCLPDWQQAAEQWASKHVLSGKKLCRAEQLLN